MKHFYTDSLAASWMKKYHGVESQMAYRGKASEQTVYYIHPDSLPLLEPQDLDIIYRTNGFCQTVGVHIGFPKAKAQIEAGGCIIMRNGDAFMWPETE